MTATVHDSRIYERPTVRCIFAWPPPSVVRAELFAALCTCSQSQAKFSHILEMGVPLGTASTASLCLSVSGRQLSAALSPSQAQPA